MVVMFMLYQMDKSRIKISLVYDEKYNDDQKKVRENYIIKKITDEYLFLNSIEKDKEKIARNKLSNLILTENFYEKFTMNSQIKYEGITMIENTEIFYNQINVVWKYYLGHCFVLVCRDDENILMASNFLTILENFAKEELLIASEKFLVILDTLLPSGQLLFMTLTLAHDLIKN